MSNDQKVSDDTAEWRIATTNRINDVEISVRENTRVQADNARMILDIKKNTDDIVEFFETGRGTLKFLKYVGAVAKWISAVAAAVAITWLMWKGGNK